MLGLLVAAEDRAGFETVRHIGDELMNYGYVADNPLEVARVWLKFRGDDYFHSSRASEEAHFGVRTARRHGGFGREGAGPDYAQVSNILLVVDEELEVPKVLIISRDEDNQPRRQGALRAIDEFNGEFDVVLAYACPEVEAWHIALGREQVGDAMRTGLGLAFDPTKEPEKLSSTSGNRRDAKVVKDRLQIGEAWRITGRANVLRLTAGYDRCGLEGFTRDLDEVLQRHLNLRPE